MDVFSSRMMSNVGKLNPMAATSFAPSRDGRPPHHPFSAKHLLSGPSTKTKSLLNSARKTNQKTKYRVSAFPRLMVASRMHRPVRWISPFGIYLGTQAEASHNSFPDGLIRAMSIYPAMVKSLTWFVHRQSHLCGLSHRTPSGVPRSPEKS